LKAGEHHGKQASMRLPFDPGSLAETRFLAHFEAGDQRRLLEAEANRKGSVTFSTMLEHETEGSLYLHVLLDGWAYRFKTTAAGQRQIVALVMPGEIANLDALTSGRSGFGVRALTRSRTMSIPWDKALGLAKVHADIAAGFARLALTENAILSQWAVGLGRQFADRRMAHFLCEVAVRLSDGRPSGTVTFNLPLTQELLADTLGMTVVHVNRTVRKLRESGMVAFQRQTVTIPDIARLEEFADFDPAYLSRGIGDLKAGVISIE